MRGNPSTEAGRGTAAATCSVQPERILHLLPRLLPVGLWGVEEVCRRWCLDSAGVPSETWGHLRRHADPRGARWSELPLAASADWRCDQERATCHLRPARSL